MVFSNGFVDGLVIAATAQDDRGPDGGLAALAPGLARRVRERLDALAAEPRAARHRALREIIDALSAVPTDAALPPRIAAILAASAPRAIGSRWAAGAPRVRRGFRVSGDLKRTLRRLASPPGPEVDLVREAPWRA